MVRTEIINIGDELLIGQVVNTNASYMGRVLNDAGFDVVATSVIGDDAEQIKQSLNIAMDRADVVLITGGLGPTKDDITKKTLADIFGGRLVENEQVRIHVENYFLRMGKPFTQTNREQALVPDNCKVVFNEAGTAPGMCFKKNGKLVFSMPGVPFEMKAMMGKVTDIIREHFKGECIIHKTMLFAGIGESFLADMLKSFEEALPQWIRLAYLPKAGLVRLRLTAKGSDKALVESAMEEQTKKLLSIAADYFAGFQTDNIAKSVGDALRKKGMTVSTAESCTGGNIAHLITLCSGSSDYYKGSVVCYSNSVKQEVLKVSGDTLEKEGAVSEEVAKSMACGVRKLLKTDYSIATTGIAGPSGGSNTKPVGTVWIAVSSKERTFAQRFVFQTERENFIERTSNQALMMLFEEIRK